MPNPLVDGGGAGAKPPNNMALIPFTTPGTLPEYVGELMVAVDVYMDEHPLPRHLMAFVSFLGILAITVGTMFAVRTHCIQDTRRARRY